MGNLQSLEAMENAAPEPESKIWFTFYMLEGPVYKENITIFVLDGKGLFAAMFYSQYRQV